MMGFSVQSEERTIENYHWPKIKYVFCLLISWWAFPKSVNHFLVDNIFNIWYINHIQKTSRLSEVLRLSVGNGAP